MFLGSGVCYGRDVMSCTRVSTMNGWAMRKASADITQLEREVKKANRELSNLLSTLETPMSRIEIVQKRYAELLTEMKKTEREHIKSKKRADQLQKEKDASRSELSKMTTVKEKLEKLCRELQKENKKLKVC